MTRKDLKLRRTKIVTLGGTFTEGPRTFKIGVGLGRTLQISGNVKGCHFLHTSALEIQVAISAREKISASKLGLLKVDLIGHAE